MSELNCPVCSTVVRVGWANIGKKGRCEGCDSKFVVPERPGDEIKIIERGETCADQADHRPEAENKPNPVEQ